MPAVGLLLHVSEPEHMGELVRARSADFAVETHDLTCESSPARWKLLNQSVSPPNWPPLLSNAAAICRSGLGPDCLLQTLQGALEQLFEHSDLP